jgi:hypothetical protein
MERLSFTMGIFSNLQSKFLFMTKDINSFILNNISIIANMSLPSSVYGIVER